LLPDVRLTGERESDVEGIKNAGGIVPFRGRDAACTAGESVAHGPSSFHRHNRSDGVRDEAAMMRFVVHLGELIRLRRGSAELDRRMELDVCHRLSTFGVAFQMPDCVIPVL
jgi:hypothetical protein